MAFGKGYCFLGAILLVVLQPSNAITGESPLIQLSESNIIEHSGFRPGGAGPEHLLTVGGKWNPNPRPWFVSFDFGNIYQVNKVEIRNFGDTTHDVTNFTIESSNDNKTWTLVDAIDNVSSGTSEPQYFSLSGEGQFWKLTVKQVASRFQPWIRFFGFFGEIKSDGGEGGDVEDIPCNWPTGQQYWPHPTNCHMFVQCTPAGPQEMQCAPGTDWSQSLLTCDYEDNTDCGQHPPPPPPPEKSCPSPYKVRGTECFFVHEDKNDLLNWNESRERCLSMGGDLAEPQDMDDFVEYIKESYSNNKPTIWLGATDREVEQDWYWVSGEPVPPAMWKPWPGKQPSGDGNCMEIHYRQKQGFYMNDWHCHNKGYFACEFKMK